MTPAGLEALYKQWQVFMLPVVVDLRRPQSLCSSLKAKTTEVLALSCNVLFMLATGDFI